MLVLLFIIGVLILAGKLVWLAVRAAWGLVKGLLFVVTAPLLLAGLFVAGLVSLALPLLALGLLAAFLLPLGKGI